MACHGAVLITSGLLLPRLGCQESARRFPGYLVPLVRRLADVDAGVKLPEAELFSGHRDASQTSQDRSEKHAVITPRRCVNFTHQLVSLLLARRMLSSRAGSIEDKSWINQKLRSGRIHRVSK